LFADWPGDVVKCSYMLDNLISVAAQVGILFAIIAVGATLRRAKVLNDAVVKGFVDVLILAVTPSLIIVAFQRDFSSAMLQSLGWAALLAFAAHFFGIAFAGAAIRHPARGTRSVLRVAAVFSNAGFMGIPLEQALFGEEGVFYGIVYVGVFNVMMWSWGICTMRGGSLRRLSRADLRAMFVNPGTIGLLVGLPLFFLSVKLPMVVLECARSVASLNTPLAMLVIGYYLAGARLGKVLRTPSAYLAGGFRLVVFPFAVIGAMAVARRFVALESVMLLSLAVSASAPVAALTSIFAAKYGGDVDMSVGMVGGTTILSIFTMPPIIAFAMHLLQ